MQVNQRYISKKEALKKLQRYCAYQERCHWDVRRKLFELRVFGNDAEEIIMELILENFLNEERFAQTFARGKFRIKQWGRNKIINELKFRDIPEYCIRKALEEIDEQEYLSTLRKLAEKKFVTTGGSLPARRNKTAKYLISRGYEPEMVWEVVNSRMIRD